VATEHQAVVHGVDDLFIYEGLMKTEAQKAWDALKKIYGKNLAAAVVNVLIVEESKLQYITVVLPGDLKEKANENT
jgi:hypothetical protein